MRFVRRDVRDHIAYQKNDHGASYRPCGLCSGRDVEKSSFARFSRPFDFRLLQQYRGIADMVALACWLDLVANDPMRTLKGQRQAGLLLCLEP